MNWILGFLCLSVGLLQSGCAIAPPIDQQTLQEQQQTQAAKKSDAFARDLAQ